MPLALSCGISGPGEADDSRGYSAIESRPHVVPPCPLKLPKGETGETFDNPNMPPKLSNTCPKWA